MKKFRIIIYASLILFGTTSINAQLKIRSDEYMQIGYNDYRTLTFGTSTGTPNNGAYGVEYWQGGLNFWKPWPTWPYANYILFLRDDTNVGIGTQGDSYYKLKVAGKVHSSGFETISDERLKSEIKPIENSLSKVLQLKGISYKYNFEFSKYDNLSDTKFSKSKENTIKGDNKITADKKKKIGFLAQDIQKVIPETVQEDDNGYLSINYDEIIPLLVESIKEQQSIINAQADKLMELEAKIDKLIDNSSNSDSKSKSKSASQGNINNTIKSDTRSSKSAETNDSELSISKNTFLYQNTPNPFTSDTEIKYFIPSSAKNPVLNIYSLQGKLISSKRISTIGQGSTTINGNELKAGIYIYKLTIDGVEVDAKRMVLTE